MFLEKVLKAAYLISENFYELFNLIKLPRLLNGMKMPKLLKSSKLKVEKNRYFNKHKMEIFATYQGKNV